MVDDDGVAGGALAVVPADGGGELGVVVGAEDLEGGEDTRGLADDDRNRPKDTVAHVV